MNSNNQPLTEIQELQKQMDFYMQAITQIKGRLEALDNSMNTLLYSRDCLDPIGPLKLPLLQGVQGDIEYYRLLNTVFIQGSLTHPITNGSPSHFAQLPEGFKPKCLQKRSAIGSMGSSSLFLEINQNGMLIYNAPFSLNNNLVEVFTIDISFHV